MINGAKIALDPSDPYKILTKPHGHGGIRSLLLSHQLVKSWVEAGIHLIVFFQDTIKLGFAILPLSL